VIIYLTDGEATAIASILDEALADAVTQSTPTRETPDPGSPDRIRSIVKVRRRQAAWQTFTDRVKQASRVA
jgi:hypothetical protein